MSAADAAWYLRYIQDDGARTVVRIRIRRLVQANEPNEAYEGDNTDREKEGHARVTGPNEVTITFVRPTLNFMAEVSEVGGGTGGAIMSQSYFESMGATAQGRSDGLIVNPNRARPVPSIWSRSPPAPKSCTKSGTSPSSSTRPLPV